MHGPNYNYEDYDDIYGYNDSHLHSNHQSTHAARTGKWQIQTEWRRK